MTNWDVEKIRKDFPVLSQTVNDKPLVYLDNSASSQVPQVVIDRGSKYLEEEHSNIHRGVHYLSQHATTAYEAAREKVKRFINAREAKECIFVRGTTEGVNLVAYSYGRKFIGEGDEILVSQMEHHSNIIPWQVVAEERGAKIRVIPMNERGELIIDEYENMLNERTKIVAVAHVSNSLGTINPIKEMTATAHKVRRAGLRRCGPERAAFPGRCSGPRLRLLCLSPATRCSPRRAAASCTANANGSIKCRHTKPAAG